MTVTLLGPQRLAPNVNQTLHDLGVRGPIAAITAGWEERELEDDELAEHCGGRTRNLELWERCERAFDVDRELREILWKRHDRLTSMQRLYRLRLNHGMDAANALLDQTEDADLVAEEFSCAIEAVRRLDQEHQDRVAEIHAAYEAEIDAPHRPSLVPHRLEVAKILRDSGALAIAGGHVSVLMNRLRLFGIFEGSADDLPVIAWSAGAMVLGEQVVVFHDSPPQGQGYAEVLGPGLARHRGALPFPHARRRLMLDDTARVTVLARRFAPLLPVPMDEGARIDWNGAQWCFSPNTRLLGTDGTVRAAS